MSQQFFVRRGNQEQGPFTPEQLKQLAATGKLVASDLVRTSEKLEWRQAGSVKGLFPPASPRSPVPPPPPPRSPQNPPAPSTAPATATSNAANVASTVRSGLTDVLTTAKQAKDLAAAHARKTQINQMTLPKAYLALGKEIFEAGRFRDQFGDIFQRITAINEEIAKVAASDKDRPQATDLKGKLQAGASHLLAQGQGAKLGLQRDSLLRALGQKTFEAHGPTAGNDAIVAEITKAHAEIGRLDQEIGRLSAASSVSAKKNKFWIAGVAGAGLAMLVLCCGVFGLISSFTNSGGLSRDYYPFQPGSKRQMVSRYNVTGTDSIQSRKEITHESGGTIRIRTINHFASPAQGVDLPLPASTEERYREQNGFIEIGQRDARNGTFFYEPVIKLGATVGDTWKSDLGVSYTVLPFETKEIEGRSVRCAVIEQTSFFPNGKVATQTKTSYGRGLGPVSVLVLAPDSTGELQVKRTEQLMPTLHERSTETDSIPPSVVSDPSPDDQRPPVAGSVASPVLKTPTKILPTKATGNRLSFSTNGQYLLVDQSQLLHVPSSTWMLTAFNERHALSMASSELVTVGVSNQLSLHTLEGSALTKKVSLALESLGHQYGAPQFSPDAEYVAVEELDSSWALGVAIFKVHPALHEIARIRPPAGNRDSNPERILRCSSKETALMSRSHVYVQFEKSGIMGFELGTGKRIASWPADAGMLLQATLDGDQIAVERGEYSQRTLVLLDRRSQSERVLCQLAKPADRWFITMRQEKQDVLLGTAAGGLQAIGISDSALRSTENIAVYKKRIVSALSDNRAFAVFLANDGNLHVWSISKDEEIAVLGPTTADIPLSLGISNDAGVVASIRPSSGRVEIWELNSSQR
jgi:hypothetical protein